MKANAGDWLIVRSRVEGTHLRKAEIIATHPGGDPPYTVRWLEDDHESLVFPGPDAQVMSAEAMAEWDRQTAERTSAAQASLGGDRSGC